MFISGSDSNILYILNDKNSVSFIILKLDKSLNELNLTMTYSIKKCNSNHIQ